MINIKIIKYGTAWCMSCIVMDNVIKDLKDIYEFEYVCYDLDNDREKFLNFDENEKLPVIEFVDNNGNVLKTINGEHSKKEVENVLISLEEK